MEYPTTTLLVNVVDSDAVESVEAAEGVYNDAVEDMMNPDTHLKSQGVLLIVDVDAGDAATSRCM